MTDTSPKPLPGTVAPVEVVPIWKHPLIIILSIIAAIPAVLATLIQLHQIPGLPTNITAWIGSAISVLTTIVAVLRALGLLGAPVISPTAAAKVIQTDTTENK